MKYRIIKYFDRNSRGITETFWRVEKRVLFWWKHVTELNPSKIAEEYIYEKLNSK